MSRGVRRTAVGVGFALALAFSVVPSAQAAPAGRDARDARDARLERTGRSLPAAQDPGLFGRFVSFVASVIGGDPHGPQLTQGPTVDPNGLH